MILVEKRRRFIVRRLNISKGYTSFEIKLPANVKMVTGVYIYAEDVPSDLKGYIGKIAFQSNDVSDVFLTTRIVTTWTAHGKREPTPKKIPLSIEGDTTVINGWFKSTYANFPFIIQLVLEYEEVDNVTKIER